MARTTQNLSKLGKHFSDEDAARELLELLRWPNGAVCPKCGGHMSQEPMQLTGIVDADETCVGGPCRRRVGRPGPGEPKIPVMALVERGGRGRAFPLERVTGDTVQDAIRREVSLNTHMMTDELNVYHPLSMASASTT